jgi:hypothetical protein
LSCLATFDNRQSGPSETTVTVFSSGLLNSLTLDGPWTVNGGERYVAGTDCALRSETPTSVFDRSPVRNYHSSINMGDEPPILAAGGNHNLTM